MRKFLRRMIVSSPLRSFSLGLLGGAVYGMFLAILLYLSQGNLFGRGVVYVLHISLTIYGACLTVYDSDEGHLKESLGLGAGLCGVVLGCVIIAGWLVGVVACWLALAMGGVAAVTLIVGILIKRGIDS